MSVLPNNKNKIFKQISIISANSRESASLQTLKQVLDKSALHYQVFDANNQLEIKHIQEQAPKFTEKHMIIIQNSDSSNLQLNINQAKCLNIAIYCYPKKNPSRRYVCLPNAGKVVNTYNDFVSERDSSSTRIRLKSVCKSPEKIYPIYSKIFVHKRKQNSKDIYKRFAKYVLALPDTQQFQAWRELKKEKPGKKNKFFVLLSIDESEELIKNIYDNRISQYCDIGIVGVKPTKNLFYKNIGVASQDIARIIDFVSERGFNLHSIKPKIARNLSFDSCKTIQQFESIKQLDQNCEGFEQIRNKDYYELPLSVIPQKKQTMCENSKFFDSQKCDSQHIGTDPAQNLRIQSQRIVIASSKNYQKSKWAKHQGNQEFEENSQVYHSAKDKSFNSKETSKKNSFVQNQIINQRINQKQFLLESSQNNAEILQGQTYKTDKVDSQSLNISQGNDRGQIIFHSGLLSKSHSRKLKCQLQSICNKPDLDLSEQAKSLYDQKKRSFKEICKAGTSILKSDANIKIKQCTDDEKAQQKSFKINAQPRISIHYVADEQHITEKDAQDNHRQLFKTFQNDKALKSYHKVVQQQQKIDVENYQQNQAMKRSTDQTDKSKQQNQQSQDHKDDQQQKYSKSLGCNSIIEQNSKSKQSNCIQQSQVQPQSNQIHKKKKNIIRIDRNALKTQSKQADFDNKGQQEKDQSAIKEQSQVSKQIYSQILPFQCQGVTKPASRYFPSKIIQEMSQQYKSGRQSQATFLNQQLCNEGSVVSKSGKRSNTALMNGNDLSSIHNQHKNRQSTNSEEFRISNKSVGISLNTITEQQKAERSNDVIQNEVKQSVQKSNQLLITKQIQKGVQSQNAIPEINQINVEDTNPFENSNSAQSFELSVYLDKMNFRILKELENEKQQKSINIQKDLQQESRNQKTIYKMDLQKDCKTAENKGPRRQTFVNFRKENPCPQEIISQQVQQTGKEIKPSTNIRIARFSLLNEVGVEQTKLQQSKHELMPVEANKSRHQIQHEQRQNEKEYTEGFVKVTFEPKLAQESKKISQKQIINTDDKSNRIINANQTIQLSNIYSSPHKSYQNSQAPTKINAKSSYISMTTSFTSNQKVTANDQITNKGYNRAPSKVIRVSDLDLQNYIKTIDEKGRIIYKSRSLSVNSVQSKIQISEPILANHLPKDNNTILNPYQLPVINSNQGNFTRVIYQNGQSCPLNKQTQLNKNRQITYENKENYEQRFQNALCLNRQNNIIRNSDVKQIKNNYDQTQTRQRIISEKIAANPNFSIVTVNSNGLKTSKKQVASNYTGITFKSVNHLSQSQQKFKMPKPAQNSNGFGNRNSRNSGQLGLNSQIAANQFKDRAKNKANTYNQFNNKITLQKTQENVYGLVKNIKEKPSQRQVPNNNEKINVVQKITNVHNKSSTSIKSIGAKSVDSRTSISKGRLNAKSSIGTSPRTINVNQQYQIGKQKSRATQKLPNNATKKRDNQSANASQYGRKVSCFKQRPPLETGRARHVSGSPTLLYQRVNQLQEEKKPSEQSISRKDNYYQQSGINYMKQKSSNGLTQILETSKERSDSLQNTYLHTPAQTKCYPNAFNQTNKPDRHFQSQNSCRIKWQSEQSVKKGNRQVADTQNLKKKYIQEVQNSYLDKKPINSKQLTNKFVNTRQNFNKIRSDIQNNQKQNKSVMKSDYKSENESRNSSNGPVRNKKVWKISSYKKDQAKLNNPVVHQQRRSRQYYEQYFNS